MILEALLNLERGHVPINPSYVENIVRQKCAYGMKLLA
jgi:hypothetical protein